MSPTETLYNPCHQARSKPTTAYENMLGDAIERAFAAGIHDLEGLVGYLNRSGLPRPTGQPWTVESYPTEIARLAEQA
ncbi:MAG: recombinase-like helix-turn-helix domain-containing protein [Pigmentiphaga sp.]